MPSVLKPELPSAPTDLLAVALLAEEQAPRTGEEHEPAGFVPIRGGNGGGRVCGFRCVLFSSCHFAGTRVLRAGASL